MSNLITELSDTKQSGSNTAKNAEKMFFNAVLGALMERIKGFTKNPFGLCRLMNFRDAENMEKPEHSRVCRLFSEHSEDHRARTGKRSWAYEQFVKFKGISSSSVSSIILDAQAAFASFDSVEMRRMTFRSDFDLRTTGSEKTAIFVQTSDIDRSKDLFINMLFNLQMNTLCDFADDQPDGRLPVPVTLILNDFGTMAKIHNFMSMVSNMRSRAIFVMISLQAVSQLDAFYGRAWTSIINNCDNIIYFGGNDPITAEYFAKVFNVPPEKLTEMPLGHHYMKQRGQKPRFAKTMFYYDTLGRKTGSVETETQKQGKDRWTI